MLTSVPVAPSTSIANSELPSPTSDIIDDNPNRLTTYLHQLAGCYEMEVDVIVKDHCYARPWNWKPENVYVKPIKKLFFSKNIQSIEKHRQEEEIDVEGNINEPSVPPLDLARAKHVMDEFQRLANFARPDDNDDWEEKIDKTLWSPVQNRIFPKVVRILNAERLARLAKGNSIVEPVYRRTSVDTAGRRFREILSSVGWDWRLAQWLHGLLFDNLPQEYLAIYLDILQTLRLKIPQLIDKMIAVQPNINAKGGAITWETLGSLLKRSWDPVTPSLNNNRLKKLPGNPIMIITPSGVGSSVSSRQHKWISQLGALGMVVTVHAHLGLAANRMTMMVCIDQLVQATRAKIQDVRSDCPGRPIILVGFNTGSALACQIAQMEHVTAVVCLGFPFSTVEGKRGTPDDTLMDIRCPVMFIIGQNATLVRPDDLEDLREKMLVETSLVVVGSADDHLRISTIKKLSEGITQNIVDRCILDEIGDFVGSILLQPHPLPLRPTSMGNYENKNNKKEPRKRRNSTSSSVESEPNSPTLKKSRPNTPVSSTVPLTSNPTSSISKIATLNTQPTLVTVSGTHMNHTTTVKRKSRVINNQKAQFVEHLITSKLAGQNAISENGGITLNIGTLASLAPIGPIRLAPTSVNQTTTPIMKTSSNPKSSVTSNKTPKIVSTNVPLQNVPKMKAIVSTNKGFSKVISSNYRQVNVPEKSGDTKLVNVFTTVGNQIRMNTSSATAMHSKPAGSSSSGTLSNLLQNGKNPIALTSGGTPSTRVSSTSGILLTSSNTIANNITATTAATSKVTDDMGTASNTQHAMLNSTHSLDMSKVSKLPLQTAVSNNDNSPNTSCGNIVMIESSHNTRAASSSVIVPFSSHNTGSILPLANKFKTTYKSIKTMPKITVNACNLQRLQRAKPQASVQKKSLVNDIDDDLGNILDIPIIFAKDDDNLNTIEKMSPLSQAAGSMNPQEKNNPKLNSATKVVLISNKQDKLQQTANKLATSSQAIICPNIPMQNLNHVILQTRPHNTAISAKSRTGIPLQTRTCQPTVKYTKIILAKRNSVQPSQHEKNEQVIVTKTTDKINTSKLLNLEKTEQRYGQTQSKIIPKYEDNYPDDTLEIEDAIKTNIIERKFVPVSGTDYTSSVETEADNKMVNVSELKTDGQKDTQHVMLSGTAELQT